MKQRKYIKNRTNRRVAIKHFEGKNRRKGLGRRKMEKYSYYAYTSLAVLAIATLVGVISLIAYNMAL